MGRFSETDQQTLAYIAGFLDGDGSIMLQPRQKDGKIYRIKTVICFYQDSKYISEIEWICSVFGFGYVYTRNDHICELRIEGLQRVLEVLVALRPYIRFKRRQADLLIELIPLLQQNVVTNDTVVDWIEQMRGFNYFSSRRTVLRKSP